MAASEKLAIDGGSAVRSVPMPSRSLIGEEEKAAAMALFDAAIASGNAFGYNGPPEQQYEKDFVEFMGGGFADAVNSGSNAVYAALGALQLDALSEVIVPPITDPGGMMPVAMLCCVPVVADADPRSYNTAAEYIEPLITERTRAIIVAHISGDMVDMDPVMELARKHDLYVVEDCAQSHGARYKGRPAGATGHIAAYSTMFGKHHCAGGPGGIVYTTDEELHWRGRRFADRGKAFNIENASGNVVAGINCNLNDLSGAIGSVQVKKLPGIIERRCHVGDTIRDTLGTDGALSVGWQVPESQSVYWFLRMHIDTSRLRVDKLTYCKALGAEGIPVSPSYGAIPAQYPWFQEKKVFGNSGFPWDCSDYHGPKELQYHIDNAVQSVETHFNIGMHESYGDNEIQDIVTAVRKVEKAFSK